MRTSDSAGYKNQKLQWLRLQSPAVRLKACVWGGGGGALGFGMGVESVRREGKAGEI